MVAVKEGSTQFVQFCIQFSSLALLYYDYILTFPLELQYMWRKKVMVSTVLYCFCRYALLANLFYLFAIEKVVQNCKGWYQFDGYLSVCGRGAVLGVFAARTYVVCSQSKPVLAIMGFLWISVVALDFWHTTGDKCSGATDPDMTIANTALSISICVFESIGTVITAIRCVQARREVLKSKKLFLQDSNIFVFLLREGFIYFFGVFGFTLAAVVLNFAAPAGFKGKLINALVLPVSGILSARLLLYLRQNKHHRDLAMRGSQNRTLTRADGEDIGALDAFHAATMAGSDFTRSVFVSSNPDAYGEGEFGGDPVAGVREELTGGANGGIEERKEFKGSSQGSSWDDGDQLRISAEPRQRQDAAVGQSVIRP
ncbi:hypothetical protein CONPUDRAFT_79472 [Coniophora puteana RWD-64-598 SS2]|uniref:DUF6533 domain-containing protein n=1 Tax=Coniophora puteana (strain RWD-64-598) TaxID=741705 RepID=A0A5M3N9L6_CONPW|nr:uncharacterized protein CONPUDRAFT_79472 [Coniophora puteana RWD-64-598 SS2]EIW87455.1 hypothetical protein CONPUDRAFT_79472 [Coniophora puteana RWD-64-598 SS2]